YGIVIGRHEEPWHFRIGETCGKRTAEVLRAVRRPVFFNVGHGLLVSIHELLRVHGVKTAIHRRRRYVSTVLYLRFTGYTALRCDDDHTIGAACTINCCR